jgi:hypothetical protein
MDAGGKSFQYRRNKGKIQPKRHCRYISTEISDLDSEFVMNLGIEALSDYHFDIAYFFFINYIQQFYLFWFPKQQKNVFAFASIKHTKIMLIKIIEWWIACFSVYNDVHLYRVVQVSFQIYVYCHVVYYKKFFCTWRSFLLLSLLYSYSQEEQQQIWISFWVL